MPETPFDFNNFTAHELSRKENAEKDEPTMLLGKANEKNAQALPKSEQCLSLGC